MSQPTRHLTLWDSTSIIVGIIIGAGIYESTPTIAASVSGPWALMGVWVLGGLASLVGAMCYAELCTAYPQEGGDYVFVREAFGRRVAFLLGWCWFWIVRPGSVGAMAFIFARYAAELRPLGLGADDTTLYAAASVVVLTAMNLVGVRTGAWTQNVLTLAKVLGLASIVLVGFMSDPSPRPESLAPGLDDPLNFSLAVILVFFTYGGWNDISYVAAEVRDPRRNLLRSLVLGVGAVTLIYLLVNAAFLRALGFEGVAGSVALATEVVGDGWGSAGARFISVLICVSSLGAIHGMLLTGGRVYYAMGRDHRLFAWLGRWDERSGAPSRSLLIQGAVTLALVAALGDEEGFVRTVAFTTPVYWFFLLLVGISLFVLRRRHPGLERPYRVQGYPLTPLLFIATCLFMLYSSVDYAASQHHVEAVWTLAAVGVGLVMALGAAGELKDSMKQGSSPT